jgi:hypothetical protein
VRLTNTHNQQFFVFRNQNKMKKATTKKVVRFTFSLILTVFILLGYIGCQKENNTTSMKTEEPSKANNPPSSSIVYTDVQPDLTSTDTYNLDLNKDGVTDFVISHTNSPLVCGNWHLAGHFNAIRAIPTGTNQVVGNGSSAINMTINTLITLSSKIWNNSSLLIASYYSYVVNPYCSIPHQANEASSSSGYLGLKLIANGQTYYGWVNLSTSLASSFTIREYAYNAVPNHSILAGQTQ